MAFNLSNPTQVLGEMSVMVFTDSILHYPVFYSTNRTCTAMAVSSSLSPEGEFPLTSEENAI